MYTLTSAFGQRLTLGSGEGHGQLVVVQPLVQLEASEDRISHRLGHDFSRFYLLWLYCRLAVVNGWLEHQYVYPPPLSWNHLIFCRRSSSDMFFE